VSLVQTVVFIGISMGTGDAICQHLEHRGNAAQSRDVWDPARSARMAAIGTFITGPFSHCWQLVLETLIPGNRGARVLLLKISANAAWAFIFSIPLMFTAVTLLTPAAVHRGGLQPPPARQTLKDARRKIETDLIPTFAAGTLFWPAANYVVFLYCPVQRRAIVNSFCGVLWNIFLSFQANSTIDVEDTGAVY
jgi:protein Mpv17